MALTHSSPSHEIAATLSIGSHPHEASSQKSAARNALARSRPRPPIERSVARTQTTQPISSTTPTNTIGGRHCHPVLAAHA